MKTTYYIKIPDRPSQICIADISEPSDWSNGAWWIHRINVPSEYRSRGYGSQLLRQILSDADEEGAELALQPYASGLVGLNDVELEAWYERHGFTWVKQGEEIVYMLRKPAS